MVVWGCLFEELLVKWSRQHPFDFVVLLRMVQVSGPPLVVDRLKWEAESASQQEQEDVLGRGTPQKLGLELDCEASPVRQSQGMRLRWDRAIEMVPSKSAGKSALRSKKNVVELRRSSLQKE